MVKDSRKSLEEIRNIRDQIRHTFIIPERITIYQVAETAEYFGISKRGAKFLLELAKQK